MKTLTAKLTARYALMVSALTCSLLGVIFSLIFGWPTGWNGTIWMIFASINAVLDAAAAWIIYAICSALCVVCDQIARFFFKLSFGYCYK